MTTKLKKPIALLLAVTMAMLLNFPSGIFGIDLGLKASAAEITPTEPKTDNGVYQIGTAEELYWFAALVNGGTSKANAVLTADITVNENVLKDNGTLSDIASGFTSWTPIGYYNSSSDKCSYTGTFDGQGHTISGLYFNDTQTSYVGLFGYVGNGGRVLNVGVVDSYFSGSGMYIGGVCGYNYYGTIKNCYNKGTVSGSNNNVGGVCGKNIGGTIESCYNTGSVNGNSKYVGGVCGYNDEGTIESCYNTGSVSGGERVGGVCGYNYYYNKGTITNCYNTGSVNGSGMHIGGVCGENYKGTITNCYNTGSVKGSSYVGGVCGYTDKGTITNCYNTGSVNGANYIGGVCGDNSGATIKNCYYLKTDNINKDIYAIGNWNTDPAGEAESKNITLFTEICGLVGYHSHQNGICIWCRDYVPATLTTDKYDINGDDTPDVVYEISSAGQLYWFAGLVNGTLTDGTTQNKAACAKLTADINVNGESQKDDVANCNGTKGEDWIDWTPIGKASNQYTGTFDGSNGEGGSYTISGLYFNNASTNNVGLFGYLGNGGSIKNINIADSYFYGKEIVGGVCGYNYGTIENCSNSGTVRGQYVGGVCSNNIGGTIKNCSNSGAVTDVSVSGTDVGGVCAFTTGTIENCSNSGAVTGSGEKVGGVCGNSNAGTIKKCSNSGAVTGKTKVGGVCGYNSADTNKNATIENCYNTGSVSCSSYVGGVCGYNNGGTINFCYSTGVFDSENAGGVCGYNWKNTIKNCYYDNTKTSTAVSSGASDETVTGKDTDAFASGEVCYLLNSSTSEGENLVWGQTLDNENPSENDAYPVFHNEKNTVYYGYPTCDVSVPIQYTNKPVSSERPAHEDDNGICKNCGIYFPAKDSDNDGYYEISNAGNLYWFAGLVNGDKSVCDYDVDTNPGGTKQNNAAKAKLTADINVNGDSQKDDVATCNGTKGDGWIDWTPIGSERFQYNGTFDGGSYTISGLYFINTSTDYVGLFGYVGYKGVVKNINIADSYFNGKQYVGGVCGWNHSGTIQNCSTSGTVKGETYVGGVCGYNWNNTIKNCYNTGTVTGTGTGSSHVGGVCGHNCGGTINFCYSKGTVTGETYVGGVCGYFESGTITYCYYLAGTSTDAIGLKGGTLDKVESKTTDEFGSGEVCYLLNNSKSDGTLVWGQTLGENGNAFPVFHNDTNTVYYGFVNCASENASYGNSKLSETKPEHNHAGANYTCSICKNSIVNIVGFGSPQYNVLSSEEERTFANVREIVDGTAQDEKSITVAENSGLLTVYFKIDDSFKLVKSYKLEVTNSTDSTDTITATSKCKTIFANIGMAQIVSELQAGTTYNITLTLYADEDCTTVIRTETTTKKVTVE